MTPQVAFDSYILQQASCRASLLVARRGLPRDDWEDLRQEMVLDCLERMSWFDSARGDLHAFVRGVIRHESAAIAWRESRRIRYEALPEIAEDGDANCDILAAAEEPASADPSAQLALSADVQRVIASLPDNLQALATEFKEMTVSEIAAKRGTSTQWIYATRKRLRKAFVEAGVLPHSVRREGVQ